MPKALRSSTPSLLPLALQISREHDLKGATQCHSFEHPETLTTRSNFAGCTGQTGDARTALRLFEELLPDQERVLGTDHPDTLRTRNNIAHCIGETGDGRTALLPVPAAPTTLIIIIWGWVAWCRGQSRHRTRGEMEGPPG
jgi:hypothetical protein